MQLPRCKRRRAKSRGTRQKTLQRGPPRDRPEWGVHPVFETSFLPYDSDMQDMPPILIAEDDDDDFYFLRRAIRQADIENPLLRFRDGSELVKFIEQLPAMDSASSERAWLLLLDITMPLMNGFEVLQWLKAHDERVRVRPVMLSGSYRPDDIERAIGLGAVDYLIKPITAPILAQVAAKQLGAPLPAAAGRGPLR